MATKPSKSIFQISFLQALGVALYCSLISFFVSNGEKIFGGEPPVFIWPIVFLLLFSFSVLVCALLVFYKPYQLFFDGKKKEAADLVLATTGWIFVFFVAFLAIAIFI